MAISDQLTLLNNTKTAIRTAINNKGGSVSASDTFASYATAITNLPSGGSDSTLKDLIDRYITSINIPSGTTRIGSYAFCYCFGLTSVTIPSSVTSIGQYAFNNCTGLTSVTIPSSVTSIGECGFKWCKITNIVIPDSVTSIEKEAFYNNNATNLTIGSGVRTIGIVAFANNPTLQSIIVNATTPPTLSGSSQYQFAFYGTGNCPIYVPSSTVATYKAATNWSTYASRIVAIAQVATVDGNPVYNYDIGNKDATVISDTERSKIPTGDSIEFAEGVTQICGQLGAYEEVILPSTFLSFNDTQPINAATTTLTSKATTPPSVERSNLGGSGLTAIYVPASAIDTYKAHAAWGTFSSIIQAIPTE